MKICLVRPPCIVNPVAYVASLTPPIGLAYLAATARQGGHDVVVVDGIGERPDHAEAIPGSGLLRRGLSFEDIVARIPSDADLIGVSCMFSSEWTQVRRLVNAISAAFPSTVLIGGGEHFTAAPEISMTNCPGMTACVVGEGEETLLDLANTVAKGAPLDGVPGLVLRTGNGFLKTGKRSRIRSIDDIPVPAWDLIPIENYLGNGLSYGVNRGRSMAMVASRGCPYECTFCSNPLMWTTRWLARDPVKVVDEIAGYVARYHVANVDFFDLTAIVQRSWIIQFCHELIARKLQVTWQLPSGTRSEAIDREVAHWMYKSGCRNVNYAPESGSEKTLKDIKKKVKLPHMIESIRGAVAEGLNVKINIIIGLPDERHRDLWATLWLLVRLSWCGAHDVSVGAFAPYPGSALYDRLAAEGKISHSDAYWDMLAYVDISETVSYDDHISSRALRAYNWLGFAIFYGTNYLFRPLRFFRTLRNLASDRHESRGEMALAALMGRIKTARAARQS